MIEIATARATAQGQAAKAAVVSHVIAHDSNPQHETGVVHRPEAAEVNSCGQAQLARRRLDMAVQQVVPVQGTALQLAKIKSSGLRNLEAIHIRCSADFIRP